MINRIPLGTTDSSVSQLGLGCINFGTTTDEATAHKLIDTYLELGGNYLDTANNYAFWNGGDGRSSERVIGTWNHKHPELRKNYLLATKLGALPCDVKKALSPCRESADVFLKMRWNVLLPHFRQIILIYFIYMLTISTPH